MRLIDDGPAIILREDNSSRRDGNRAFDVHRVVRISVMETVVEQTRKKDSRAEYEWIQVSKIRKDEKCRRRNRRNLLDAKREGVLS